ncbi:MAG: hypothetical protein ACLFNJ_10585, partial [Bacteroidales bacterium]
GHRRLLKNPEPFTRSGFFYYMTGVNIQCQFKSDPGIKLILQVMTRSESNVVTIEILKSF